MILDDQIDQELLKRSVTIRDTTTVTGMLKGDGSVVSAGIPNLDYVPAISGTNYLKLDNTGVSSKGDLTFLTSDGNSSFQLGNITWAVNMTDGADAYIQFSADTFGGMTVNASGLVSLSTLTTFQMSGGSCFILADSTTGFLVTDETGANTITLTVAGMDVTAPYLKLNGSDVGGIADAPSDGKIYVRRNGAWEELVIS